MSETLRAAVIGVGAMGQHHVRVYREIPGVELVGIADADENIRASIGHRHSVHAYADYRELLDQEKPNLVSIAVPTVLHREFASEAMQRGINVLVEKPIAETEADGQAMLDMARQKGVVLAMGHIERHNPAIAALKERLGANLLGSIFEVRAERVGAFPPRIKDVGVVLDLATHDIDIICHLVDSPLLRVFAETQQNVHGTREDMVSGLLRFANGVTGIIQINWLTPVKRRRLTITGAGGMYEVDYITQDLTFYENGYTPGGFQNLQLLRGMSEGRIIREIVPKGEPLRLELEDFIQAIREKHAPRVTGEHSLNALRVARALVQSGLNHEVVTLSEQLVR